MAGNTANALLFLINTLFGLYLAIVLLRINLQLVRADFFNPLAQFIWQATQPLLHIPSRYIPRWRHLDIAALLLLFVIAFINIRLDIAIMGWAVGIGPSLFLTVLKLLVLALNLYTFTILAQAVMSWLGPNVHGPASALLWNINEPLLRPVRRYIPPLGGIDLSPLLIILGLQVIARLIPLHYVFR
ncbi:MAG: YggT family protein [Nevskiales bacterium]